MVEAFHNFGVLAIRFKVKGHCRPTILIYLLSFPDLHQTKDFRGETWAAVQRVQWILKDEKQMPNC